MIEEPQIRRPKSESTLAALTVPKLPIDFDALAEKLSDDENLRLMYDCFECRDTGFIVPQTMPPKGEYPPSKPCGCRRLKQRFRAALALTPRKFSWITDGLNSVPEMPKLHPRQPVELRKIRKNPDKSYFFWGKTGTHKTTLALALMQEAGRRGQKVSYDVGRALIDNIRQYQLRGIIPGDKPLYSLDQLETSDRLCILIDELEDTASSLTSYTLSILFGIVERCQAYEHQLLITSNTRLEVLLERWIERDRDGSADAENYAHKIGRRIAEMCVDVDFS